MTTTAPRLRTVTTDQLVTGDIVVNNGMICRIGEITTYVDRGVMVYRSEADVLNAADFGPTGVTPDSFIWNVCLHDWVRNPVTGRKEWVRTNTYPIQGNYRAQWSAR